MAPTKEVSSEKRFLFSYVVCSAVKSSFISTVPYLREPMIMRVGFTKGWSDMYLIRPIVCLSYLSIGLTTYPRYQRMTI